MFTTRLTYIHNTINSCLDTECIPYEKVSVAFFYSDSVPTWNA